MFKNFSPKIDRSSQKSRTKTNLFWILCIYVFFLSGCATTGTVKSKLQKTDSGLTRIYKVPPSELKDIALEVLRNYRIKIDKVEESQDRTEIIGKKGVSAFSWGELVGILIIKSSDNESSVKVISERRLKTNITAKNWTSDILDGISAGARFSIDSANNEKYEKFSQTENWLISINKALTPVFAFESNPTLGVKCEGRFGDYIASKIITHLGDSSARIQLVASSGENLKSIIEQQRMQLTGLFDEQTAVEAGKLIGAKYLLVCSPYIKKTIAYIELHCKLVNIESGKFLGGGIIVYIPEDELPI